MSPVRKVLTSRQLSAYVGIAIMCCQAGAGLSYLTFSSSHTQGPSYRPAKSLFNWLPGDPQWYWGAILVFLTAMAAASLIRDQEPRSHWWMAGLCGYWSFWAFIWFCAWGHPGAGLVGPWLALITAIGNARPILTRLYVRGG